MLLLLEKALALRAASLFASLSADELLPVAELCTEVSLAEGESLFAQGEVGDSLYVVVNGKVGVFRDDLLLVELGAGECVGELAALDLEPRSATVAARAPTDLIRLERDDLFDLLGDSPDLVRALATVLVRRLRATPR